MLQHLLNCFLAVGLACHLTFSKPNMHIFVARVVLTCHNFKLRSWSSSGANWLLRMPSSFFFGLNYYIYEGCYAWMSYAILYYMIFRWMGRYLKGMLLLVEMSMIYRQWSPLFGRLTFVWVACCSSLLQLCRIYTRFQFWMMEIVEV